MLARAGRHDFFQLWSIAAYLTSKYAALSSPTSAVAKRPIMISDLADAVQEALTEEQVAACFPVIQTLRLHFTSQADFVARVRRQQQDGYHLLFIGDGSEVQGIAGYRIREDIETPHPKCAAGLRQPACLLHASPALVRPLTLHAAGWQVPVRGRPCIPACSAQQGAWQGPDGSHGGYSPARGLHTVGTSWVTCHGSHAGVSQCTRLRWMPTCRRLTLDSGVQRGRAHKFYFNCGLTISSYRFQKPL